MVSFMACRISELVLGCRDPEVLARFWCEVLDFVVLDREDDGTLEIGPREGFGGLHPTIILSVRDEPEPGKPRLHIDVNATDRDQDAELERLLRLGARLADIGQTGEESWHVLADPEGNEFCLLKARLDPLDGTAARRWRSPPDHQAVIRAANSSGLSSQVKWPASRMSSLLCGSRWWRNSELAGGTARSWPPAMCCTGVWMAGSRSRRTGSCSG